MGEGGTYTAIVSLEVAVKDGTARRMTFKGGPREAWAALLEATTGSAVSTHYEFLDEEER